MNAKIRPRIISGESKSMIHSICRIQIIVKITNKICETGNVSIAFVQFQKSFFSFIIYFDEKYKLLEDDKKYYYIFNIKCGCILG